MGHGHVREHAMVAALLGAAVVGALGSAGCGGNDSEGASGGASPSSDTGPIVVGISAAKTGLYSVYDNEPGKALELRAKEINAAGGALGRKIEVEWIDTKSDRALSSTNATELIEKGAVAIAATCDFDYGSPASIAAQQKGIPSISLCASDPKFSDVNTLGDRTFTMGSGTDVKGSLAAEWVANKKGWKRTYVLQDQAIEYDKSLGRYFIARFEELGGSVVGSDTFEGGENVDVSAQVTKMRGKLGGVDFITLPSTLPGAGTVLRTIRAAGITTPVVMPGAAVDGPLVTQLAGKLSDYYAFPYTCYVYCTGAGKAPAATFAEDYKTAYGASPSSSYAILGYDLMTVLANAIEKAGSTDGKAIVAAIEQLPAKRLLSGEVRFSPTCHKPIRRPHAVVEYRNGKATFVEEYRAQTVPDVGDSNPCAGA
jgi:branched-chain amino acid transport system substrate-binding protein